MNKKVIHIDNLAKCPICKGESILEQNSSKYFRVRCTECGHATKFTNKAQAVANWSYEKILSLERENLDFYRVRSYEEKIQAALEIEPPIAYEVDFLNFCSQEFSLYYEFQEPLPSNELLLNAYYIELFESLHYKNIICYDGCEDNEFQGCELATPEEKKYWQEIFYIFGENTLPVMYDDCYIFDILNAVLTPEVIERVRVQAIQEVTAAMHHRYIKAVDRLELELDGFIFDLKALSQPLAERLQKILRRVRTYRE